MARPKKIKSNVINGLSEAILGFNFPPGLAGSAQVSQSDTMWKNLRYYAVSNLPQLLSRMYFEHGLVRTLVDLPVDDALRGGLKIHSEQLDEDEIKKISNRIDRDGILHCYAQGKKWERLFGGGGIVIGTDIKQTEEPFKMEEIKPGKRLGFEACDMWQLYGNIEVIEGDDGKSLAMPSANGVFQYRRAKGIGKMWPLHTSRVITLRGMPAPSFLRQTLRGWGVSVIEECVQSINQYLKNTELMFEVLDEFKVDVYKIQGLYNLLMSPGGDSMARKRIQLANQEKSFNRAITMDKEDDFITKELAFSGLAEVMDANRRQICGDLRFPETKLCGTSAKGFSAGQEDLENYNAMVESTIRYKMKYDLIKIIELLCQNEFGDIPTDLDIEFEPMRVLSAEQEENVKNAHFNRLLAAKSSGLISQKDFAEASNKYNLLGVQVDPELDLPEVPQDADVEVPTQKPKAPSSAPKENET